MKRTDFNFFELQRILPNEKFQAKIVYFYLFYLPVKSKQMKSTRSSTLPNLLNQFSSQCRSVIPNPLVIILKQFQILHQPVRNLHATQFRHPHQRPVTRYRKYSRNNRDLNSRSSAIFHEIYKNFRFKKNLRYDNIRTSVNLKIYKKKALIK